MHTDDVSVWSQVQFMEKENMAKLISHPIVHDMHYGAPEGASRHEKISIGNFRESETTNASNVVELLNGQMKTNKMLCYLGFHNGIHKYVYSYDCFTFGVVEFEQRGRVGCLRDIKTLLFDNLNSRNEQISNHAKTLCGPRLHGSTTSHGLNVLPDFLVIEEHKSETIKEGCECYKISRVSGYIDCQLGAVSVSQATTMGLKIEERDGVHGRELFGKSPFGLTVEMPSCDDIYVIIGDYLGERVIFTWHPGAPLVPGVDQSNRLTAVKLV